MTTRFFISVLLAVVLTIITGSAFFGVILGIIAGSWLGDSRKLSFSKAQNNDIISRQVQGMAKLLGFLLKETNQHTNANINKAKENFIRLVGERLPKDKNIVYSTADQLYQYSVDSIQIDETISNLNNSFHYRTAGNDNFNQAEFFNALTELYINSVNKRDIDFSQLQKLLKQIANGLGIPPILVAVILMRYQEFHQEFRYEGYSGFGGGGYYEGGYNQGGSGYYDFESESKRELEKAYAVLGVDSSITKEGLKSVKRKLLIKWHPDKAPAGKEEEYSKKTQEINNAVDFITQYHNW